jgi:phenylalanyl-tRNA synthetase alpha chain
MARDEDLLEQIRGAPDLGALESLRVSMLGKSGRITAQLKSLGSMDPDTRAAEAPKIHELREAVTSAIAERKAALEAAELDRKLATERLDLSLPAPETPQGTVHPVSQVMDELAEVFADLGIAVAEGPEIEEQWYNFTALNMGESHPARAMMDTFYLEPRARDEEPRVLRTHTSPVQIRAMQERGAPLRIIAPGRVYRSDSDATHTPMFHQIEGLVIDRAIHLGHLKWTLETFLRAFFERDDVVLRMRPSYFPFTEPSAEVDVGYSVEQGRRVVGGQEGWMEVLGSGMVHPRVIANCGLDPDQWQGFAFGTGVDRLAMLKYGMDDLRAFFDADLRWLKHYGFRALDVPTLSGGVGA